MEKQYINLLPSCFVSAGSRGRVCRSSAINALNISDFTFSSRSETIKKWIAKYIFL